MPTITKPRPIADKNNDIKFTNTSFFSCLESSSPLRPDFLALNALNMQ